jgi:formate dehydrogenase maturation protein FdhE
VVNEGREVAIAMHTQDLLRNSRVKAELAHFLILQAQIQRMASLANISGRVDELIAAALKEGSDEKLNMNQLLALQRSAHTQLAELTEYVRETRTEGLEGLMKTILPETNEQIANTIETIAKLDPKGREHVNTLIRSLLAKAASTPAAEAPAIDVKP